jgi:hypothetical protein
VKTPFTQADANRAHDEWGCNCGPSALAVIMGMTLDQVRPHMGDFEKKRYTNPTMMFAALKSVGARWSNTQFGYSIEPRLEWPRHGLARIQWGGPWMHPDVPPRWRYRQTHWVASMHRGKSVGIFDVNALNNGSGWVSEYDWAEMLVPRIIAECVPRADGNWHITHAVEVMRVTPIAPDHLMGG